jgi:hypothetical protein
MSKIDNLANLLKDILNEGQGPDQDTGATKFPFIEIAGNTTGNGIVWTGHGNSKQIVFNSNPDRFFVSENIDLGKGKAYFVNNINVLSDKELGPTIAKSNLREVGRLNGLIVDGSVSIGQHVVYDNTTKRVGLGTNNPNSALSILENGIEIVAGSKDAVNGFIGTFSSNNLDIGTANTTRLTLTDSGNITLGNTKLAPVQVLVHGKLSIKVNNPDPEVDLHVNGAIKFNNRLQKYDNTYPVSGVYNEGDIVWNITPRMNSYIGWVCLQAGAPGKWAPFGKIGNA